MGILFSVIAIISALLPVLPAVLFWVLAGLSFSKASPRFHHWFTNCWVYRKILVKFMKEKPQSATAHTAQKQSRSKLVAAAPGVGRLQKYHQLPMK